MKSLSAKTFLVGLLFLASVSGCETKTADVRAQREQLNSDEISAAPAADSSEASVTSSKEIPTARYEVVNTFPHDKEAFTQGLIYHNGALIESTGQYGASTLRRVDLKTGKILKKTDVSSQYFAEGLTLFRDKIYQLTWTTRKGFIYDPETFELQGEFSFDGEGWGLTHDEENLILSDGTNQIRFLDPATFEIKRTITVMDKGRPLRNLNELEYVRGEIYANIWHSDRLVRIDPRTGNILGWIDLVGLLPKVEQRDEEAVLNGIAYDAAGDRLFVTGKLWPKLFEIRLKN
ncbi:MAG TPA: glutaminyl-peptide cyclotransferase [Pyrinomonadaceae bacterium]|jgi:glutamine cyclotransferase